MRTKRSRTWIIIISAICIILVIAYFTKPDNKSIIIASVTRVWGDITPSVNKPMYYEQFMDLNSKSVHIDDWIFLKRIKYQMGDFNKTIGIAAFKREFFFYSSFKVKK